MDGRTAALRTLARYVSELTFYRSGELLAVPTATAEAVYGPPIPFAIPREQFYEEQPDNPEELTLPCITVIAGDASYNPIGMTTFVIEESRDQYGLGTVLQWQSSYDETIVLEIAAQSKAERRAIKVGLEQALVPTEQLYGLRFAMPDYFGQLVTFSLDKFKLKEEMSGQNRRKSHMTLAMHLTVVALVDAVTLRPVVSTSVQDSGDVVAEVSGPP